MYGLIAETEDKLLAVAPVPISTQAVSLTPMHMMQRALEAGNLELVERMMTLQERWEATQSRKAFEAAMAACRAELPVIIKTNEGANGAYLYEDLPAIARQIDPVLARHGLSYRFRTESGEKRLTVICIISHAAGHCEENSLSTVVAPSSRMMSDIQSIGAAQTYLQRYTLKAALGLAAGKDTDAAPVIPPEQSEDTGELISAEQVQTMLAALKVREMPKERLFNFIRASSRGRIQVEEVDAIPASIFQLCLDKVRSAGEPQ